MEDTEHYLFSQTHILYNTKSELQATDFKW